MLLARDVMTTDLITIPADSTVADAIHTLLLHGISGAPVVDDAGKLVGIISEFQLLIVVYNEEARDESVTAFMTRDVVTIDDSAPLTDAANRLIVHRIRRLPVLRNGKLVGLISRPDLLRYAIDAAVPLEPELVLAGSN